MSTRACLLGLPAELRNAIYDLALPTNTKQTFVFTNGHFETLDEEASVPALLQTCRLLRQETLPIYYGSSDFEFYLYEAGHETIAGLLLWLRSIDGLARECLMRSARERSSVVYLPECGWYPQQYPGLAPLREALLRRQFGGGLREIWSRRELYC